MHQENGLPDGWRIRSSEYLFREPWLTVRRDHLLLRNGASIPGYFVLEYPLWVNVIGLTEAGEFVLVRQYRHALGRTSYELCAGVSDPHDASPLESARRELLEETGYGDGHWQQWMILSANPATHSNLTYTFLATGLRKMSDPMPDTTEDITVHLCSKEQVREMLLHDEIVQALHAAALWKYLSLYP